MGAFLAAHALAEHQLRPELTKPWPPTASWPIRIGLETGYPVDDVAIFTQNTGFVVIQAKVGLELHAGEKSPLAEALQQAVRMFRVGRAVAEYTQDSEQPWNSDTDRILIVTDAGASKPVREHLVKVVSRLATSPLPQATASWPTATGNVRH